MQVTIRLKTDEGPKSGFRKAYRIGVVFFYITATFSYHFFFFFFSFHTLWPVLSYGIVSFFFSRSVFFSYTTGSSVQYVLVDLCKLARR